MIPDQARRFRWKLWLTTAVTVVLLVCVTYGLLHQREIRNTIELSMSRSERSATKEYVYDALSPTQQHLITILEAEYAVQPSGTKYAEGANEPWCADFVSWVMKQSDMSFVNPNSGSWRIPGTHTLRDYFIAQGNWHPYGDGYEPKLGDIAIYDGDGPFGQHTNFVLNYSSDGYLTTMGGNENGAIHVQKHKLSDTLSAVGFAVL